MPLTVDVDTLTVEVGTATPIEVEAAPITVEVNTSIPGPAGPTGPTGPAGPAGATELLSTATASNDAQIDFTTASWFDGTYPGGLLLKGVNVVPATDSVALELRVRIGGTFQTGSSYDHVHFSVGAGHGSGGTGGNDHSTIILITNLGSDTGEGCNFNLNIPDCSDTALYKAFHCYSGWINSSGKHNTGISGGAWKGATSAIDGLRLYMSSGNIESGTFKLYGLK